jgi:hypothetical protein
VILREQIGGQIACLTFALSVDAPDCAGAEIGDRWIAVDRHVQIGFREQTAQHVHDSVDAA